MNNRFPWGSVIIFIVCLVIGIAIVANKAGNCRDAGWEFHWVTEQCLPKKVNP